MKKYITEIRIPVMMPAHKYCHNILYAFILPFRYFFYKEKYLLILLVYSPISNMVYDAQKSPEPQCISSTVIQEILLCQLSEIRCFR